MGVGKKLARDEILLALNDHCGEQVFVSITAEELELRAGLHGRLLHWTESPGNLPLDAPPLRDRPWQRLWHRHVWHVWTKWSPPQRRFADSCIQTRVCEVCGKVDARDVGFYGLFDTPAIPLDEGTYRVGDAHFTIPDDVAGREYEDERGGWLEIYIGDAELSVWWHKS